MRSRIWRLWQAHAWVIVLIGFVITFILGLIGFSDYARSNDSGWSISTRVYLAVKLFTLEAGDVAGAVPLSLEIARWAAPVVVAGAAISTATALLRRQAWGWAARRYSDHVVVVGLGERGLRTATRVVKDGRRVVVIEADADNPHVVQARRLGIPVLIGDGADQNRLSAARLDRARRMVVLVGSTDQAAGVAEAVSDFAADLALRDEFCCYVAVPDAAAVRELNGLLHSLGSPIRREFFSLEDRAGTVIYDRWARLHAADEKQSLVLVGDTATTRSVFATALRDLEARNRGQGQARLVVRWLAFGAADDLHADLLAMHPYTCDASVSLTVEDVSPRRVGAALQSAAADNPALVVLGEGPDAVVLNALSAAELVLREEPTQLVAVADGGSGLVPLLRNHPRIHVFDVADELCADQNIARGQLEAMARALHDGYLRELEQSLTAEQRSEKPAYLPWDELPDRMRDKNFAAARGIWQFLRQIGYDVTSRSATQREVREFSDAELDQLAGLEFARWFGEENPGKPVPNWGEIEDQDREWTRNQMARIPVMLNAADLQVTSLEP